MDEKMNSMELLEMIRKKSTPPDDPIPTGAMSTRQYAEAWKLSDSRTAKLLKDGVKAGMLEYHPDIKLAGKRVPHYSRKIESNAKQTAATTRKVAK